MPTRRRQPSAASGAEQLADRLHSAAIHLLRRLRGEDEASGLSAPRLSALSVLVFGGARTIGELAAAEQVSAPTISRLVRDLERDGLVLREADAADARRQRIRATAAGETLLIAGRRRRVERLAGDVAALTAAERELLARAAPLLERLARREPAPGTSGAEPPMRTAAPSRRVSRRR